MIKRIFTRLGSNLSNSLRFIRYCFRVKRDTQFEKHVYFDIDEPRLERYLYWLLKMFDIAGWKVSLKASPNLLLNLRNCSEFIYDIEELEIRWTRPKEANLLIANRPMKDAILLETDYFSETNDAENNSIHLPFSMFPAIYHERLDRELPLLRENKKNIGVFIGGNLGKSYDLSEMEERFGVMNRSQVVNAVYRKSEEQIKKLTEKEDVDRIFESDEYFPLVVLDKNIIDVKDWLRLLSKSQFFIAPPGIIMPFSHNIIEAMAVGCIPITQYGRYFHPPLVDGETCLYFRDADHFLDVIDHANSFSVEEMERMRTNVLKYYDVHLEPAAVVSKIEYWRNQLDKIYLVAGHLSVHYLGSIWAKYSHPTNYG